MAEQLECIGWQWRFVFPTHKGTWTAVSSLPRTIETGMTVLGHPDTSFEVRDVFVRTSIGDTPAPQSTEGALGVGIPQPGQKGDA